jgi:putative ATPase
VPPNDTLAVSRANGRRPVGLQATLALVPPPRRKGPARPGAEDDSLFAKAAEQRFVTTGETPLAERMRPRAFAELVGQSHILGPKKALEQAILRDRIPSMILWGPPGVGKTTLGRVLARETKAFFVSWSAVLGSLQEFRAIVAAAKERVALEQRRTLVFVDEIHRFNKAQQDAFLPHVEDGTITLVGATTENPSFAVNAALLSRCKVFRLEPLSEVEIVTLLSRALTDESRGLGKLGVHADDDALLGLARAAGGDARRALASLDAAVSHAVSQGKDALSAADVVAVVERAPLLYDKAGDQHYGVVSAFIKSIRGSDPDAAVYWMMRMLDAGDDPLFVLRRMLIFASEDVGNADPRALLVVNAADQAFRRMGLPEGLFPLTHAALYLACAPKSNAVGTAFQRARALIEAHGTLSVPKKLVNGTTALMKREGYGQGYKYAHDYEGGVVPGETYLPDELVGETLYEPTELGEEARIKARLAMLRATRG